MAIKSLLAFPSEIFVRKDANSRDMTEEDLLAYKNRNAAVEDDGPTEVGVYELVGVKKLKKQVVEA